MTELVIESQPDGMFKNRFCGWSGHRCFRIAKTLNFLRIEYRRVMMVEGQDGHGGNDMVDDRYVRSMNIPNYGDVSEGDWGMFEL